MKLKNIRLAALVAAVLPCAVIAVSTTLTSDCVAELDQMWANYTNPAYITEGCDQQCLLDCKEILEEAIYTSDIKRCPRQDDITRCFKIYAPEWENYLETCAILTIDTTGSSALPGGAEGEAASSSSGEGSSSSDEEAAEGPSASEDEAAEASPSPSPSPPVDASGEGEGSRRRLFDSGEGEGDTSSSSGEGEGGGNGEGGSTTGSGICFPTFKNTQEFEAYLNGEYFSTYYEKPSDTIGIILSCFFWVGLAAMGFYLRK